VKLFSLAVANALFSSVHQEHLTPISRVCIMN